VIVSNTTNRFLSYVQGMVFLLRMKNLIILALVQYAVSCYLISLPSPFILQFDLHYIVLATLCTTAGGYIINDYYDVKIDSINRPDKVVIDRSIHRRNALIWHGIVDVFALVFAYLVSYRMLFLVACCIFFLWSYSNHFKRLPLIGNLIVAILSAVSMLLIPYHFMQINPDVLVYASFSFLLTLVREIVKDMEDREGDARFHCKTLPIILGIKRTRFIVNGFVICLLALIVNYMYLQRGMNNYLLSVVVIGLLYFLWMLAKADTTAEFKHLSSFCKTLMLVGLMSMMLF